MRRRKEEDKEGRKTRRKSLHRQALDLVEGPVAPQHIWLEALDLSVEMVPQHWSPRPESFPESFRRVGGRVGADLVDVDLGRSRE
jgi:hypothetical protein